MNMPLPAKYITDMTVLPSSCDFSGHLGVFDTFKTFMDLANTHATLLGVNQERLMDRNLFWLTVKTRVRFHGRPYMSRSMKAETWPLRPLTRKTDRCYRLSDSEGLIAEGRTEWAILDMANGTLSGTASVFPPELEFCTEELSFSDFPRIPVCDASCQVKGTYRVSSSDIDMGMHMNNTAYVRAILGLFTVDELKAMDIREMTVIFKASAHEGDILTMPVSENGNTINTGLFFPDGKPAVLVQIIH